MALSIKNENTDRVVRQYARLHRTSCTRAVHLAVTDALRREGQAVEDDTGADFMTRVREIQARVATYPVLDTRSAEDIIGYDENGLPA